MDNDQRLAYLAQVCGIHRNELSLDVIYACEQALNHEQRSRYVEFVSAEVSALTYRNHEPSAPGTADIYYFNMLHLHALTKARMIWCAVENVAP